MGWSSVWKMNSCTTWIYPCNTCVESMYYMGYPVTFTDVLHRKARRESSAPLREVAPRATLHRPSLSRAQIQVRAISGEIPQGFCTHPLTPVSTFFLFVFDAEWVMSTCEHQGRDTVLQTGLKIHWSRRSASCCFNRVWRVTKHSAKHQSMLSPWVVQHQPWPSPSAWTKTRSLHGCRNFYLLILPSLSFCLSFSLSLLLLILDRTDVCSPVSYTHLTLPTKA